MTIDVLDGEQCQPGGVSEAAELLGGTIDGIVYTSGMSPLRPLADLSVADWQQVFGVNTIGPNLVIAAALPYLSRRRRCDSFLLGLFAAAPPLAGCLRGSQTSSRSDA